MFKSITFVALVAASTLAAPSMEFSVRSSEPPTNIHPIVDSTKCVGIVDGVYANGSLVDIYDCNGSNTQRWQWYNKSILSINDTDLSRWCLDAGNVDEIQNGVQMKIWQCFADLPQQTWIPSAQSGPIALSVDNMCLDLTNGVDADRTILQIWQCVPGNTNQIWSYSAPLVN